jgi:nitrite reductase (NADH) large subunit
MKYLIIGNGVAGVEAALAIRKNDPQGEVTIVSRSEHLFYYRPRLIEYLAGEVTLDSFTIYKDDFYQKMNIKNVPGTEVVKIDPEKNTAIAQDGTEYTYDKLLLATGATCFVPKIEGKDKTGVFSLRCVGDADKIREYCNHKTKAVVIGGGLQGLEVANSLAKLGLKVTCVEVFDRLLPRQLDNEGAGLLQALLEKKGLSFVFPDSAASIRGDGKVESVALKSGEELPSDVVMVCAGIRGRDGLARESGLSVKKGIVVNDRMQASVYNIYAAGDPVEHRGRLYGLWPAAKEQGKAAGLNMAGVATRYQGTVLSSTLKVTGIDLYSAGDFGSKEGQVLRSNHDGVYKKFVFDDDRPIGAIVLGDPQAIETASKVFEGKADVEEFKKFF